MHIGTRGALSIQVVDPATVGTAADVVLRRWNEVNWALVGGSVCRQHLGKLRRLNPALKPLHRGRPRRRERLPQGKRLRSDTFSVLSNSLHQLKETDLSARLHEAVLTKAGLELLVEYYGWTDQQLERYRHAGRKRVVFVKGQLGYSDERNLPPSTAIVLFPFERIEGNAALRMRELLDLVRHLNRIGAWRSVARLCAEKAKHGHDIRRVTLIVERVIGALLDAPFAGAIERSWKEMTNEELVSFVECGVRRERILLNRPAADTRAQKLGTQPGVILGARSEIVSSPVRQPFSASDYEMLKRCYENPGSEPVSDGPRRGRLRR